MSESQRLRLIETAREMNRSGINRGTSGNLSVRFEDGMLITPSGMAYESLEPDDIVIVDTDSVQYGRREASSEWRIHYDIYAARPDASAILHAHPEACTALACMHKPIPAFHYMVAVAGGNTIACAPYATFGSQKLSDLVLAAVEGMQACLMANHGLVCLAKQLDKVLALAVEVEQLARTYLHCLAVGEPEILNDAEMERVLEKFRTYGTQDR
ncbi:MAG: class II aldolase [Xanthomonadales bacterium]|nr:class II aldolase/adducin family protein [Gammaproteobacteria bacterium]MBT8054453.1 class II aldolase/adducin family protein [Gammaproteobacteria bacterium]NND58467.1 class II aldolase [Xanthomonadales bacterium]NNK50112.1 class II aldolase [Xanthomonadales bacterium]